MNQVVDERGVLVDRVINQITVITKTCLADPAFQAGNDDLTEVIVALQSAKAKAKTGFAARFAEEQADAKARLDAMIAEDAAAFAKAEKDAGR